MATLADTAAVAVSVSVCCKSPDELDDRTRMIVLGADLDLQEVLMNTVEDSTS